MDSMPLAVLLSALYLLAGFGTVVVLAWRALAGGHRLTGWTLLAVPAGALVIALWPLAHVGLMVWLWRDDRRERPW